MPITLRSVTDKIKTAAYVGLFGGVAVGFGGIIYALYTELSETSNSSSYGLIQRAVAKVESDQRLMDYLGPGPLKVYGHSNRYGRRRPHVQARNLDDDNKTRCYETSFWVEGPKNNRKALVNFQVVEEAQKDSTSATLKERFLSVELVERGGEKIILIQPKLERNRFSWNPFSKLFQK